MNSKNTKKRVAWIDGVKSIGILAMIAGHICSSGTLFDKLIHVWHMPIFFFLSGYLFSENHYKKAYRHYIGKKVKSLLFPYFGCAALYFLIWILKYHPDVEDIKKCIISIFWVNTNNGLPIANAIWFLTALFLCDTLFATIYFIIKSANICCLIGVGVAVSTSLAFPPQGICLPWGGNAAVVGVGFYAIGYFIKKHENINFRFLKYVDIVYLSFAADGYYFFNCE